MTKRDRWQESVMIKRSWLQPGVFCQSIVRVTNRVENILLWINHDLFCVFLKFPRVPGCQATKSDVFGCCQNFAVDSWHRGTSVFVEKLVLLHLWDVLCCKIHISRYFRVCGWFWHQLPVQITPPIIYSQPLRSNDYSMLCLYSHVCTFVLFSFVFVFVLLYLICICICICVIYCKTCASHILSNSIIHSFLSAIEV